MEGRRISSGRWSRPRIVRTKHRGMEAECGYGSGQPSCTGMRGTFKSNKKRYYFLLSSDQARHPMKQLTWIILISPQNPLVSVLLLFLIYRQEHWGTKRPKDRHHSQLGSGGSGPECRHSNSRAFALTQCTEQPVLLYLPWVGEENGKTAPSSTVAGFGVWY